MNLRLLVYPQYLWAREIAKLLPRFAPEPLTIVDAPSGNGIVAYWVQRKCPEYRFVLVDISSSAMEIARHSMDPSNVDFICSDLADYLRRTDLGPAMLLLVNSLYLLPEPDRLMLHIRNRFGLVIGIFPHVGHRNFQAFVGKYPNHKQQTLMTQEETVSCFAHHSFQMVYSADLSRIHHHTFPNVRYLYPMLLRAFCFMEPLRWLRNTKGAYWIGVFKRRNL